MIIFRLQSRHLYSWLRENIKIPSTFIFERLLLLEIRNFLWIRHFPIERWRINATALSRICAKNSVLHTFVITLPHSVCQKPLRYSQERMSPFYARYHGWYDNWKVEMHPLSRYSTMRFITLLSFELCSYCFDEGREETCRRGADLIYNA